ncbi:AMP-binding protein [Rhodopirellula sp. SWK7]|uniref:AMP-binding protein n=1 Tax=Rhodopirellula sp. SWK7 TaxID=595460 RepID=UPI0002BDBC9E|nr:AMP-binding protein [Rhodopirellula sp. SWK7]EMI44693.1 long-chain fatty-acid-CoA ligase [Rhodopirellula sp. SWK7]
MTRHLLDALLHHTRERPNAVALRCPGSPPRTWKQLLTAVHRTTQVIENTLAGTTCDIDLGKPIFDAQQQRFVYECQNTEANVVTALACIACGAIEIPIDVKLPLESQSKIRKRSRGMELALSKTDLFVATDDFAESMTHLSDAANRVDIDRASLVLWTSGTTAHPRGVVLSQRNLTTNAAAKLKAVPQFIDDTRLTLLSISHAYARTCDMGTWLLSGCQWNLDYGHAGLGRMDTQSRPTLINCVPSLARTILERIQSGDWRLEKLRALGCGGAALGADLFNDLSDMGIDVIQGYGCTETSPVICSASPGNTVAGCVGSPVQGCEIKITNQRLYVRGPMVMLGYLDDSKSTAEKIDQDGWLDTGDLVERAPSGQLRILGRGDDVIVLENGFKIHPHPVEQSVLQNVRCEHAVLLSINDKLIIAIQPDALDRPPPDNETITGCVRALLPARTPFSIARLDPPLTQAAGELTSKGTPRRHIVRRRFECP